MKTYRITTIGPGGYLASRDIVATSYHWDSTFLHMFVYDEGKRVRSTVAQIKSSYVVSVEEVN